MLTKIMNEEIDLKNEKGAGSTYYHEVGHMIDDFSDKFGKTSSDSSYDFYDKLSKDVNKYIKKIMKENDCSKEEAYDKLSIWFKSISSEAFAHFFEAGMSDKSTELDYIKEIFPSAYKEYIKMIKDDCK